MKTITIEEIKADMIKANETDVYYWDALNDCGYHMHVLTNGNTICMKLTGKRIEPIAEQEFIEAVNNKCYLNSIGEDSFYSAMGYIL